MFDPCMQRDMSSFSGGFSSQAGAISSANTGSVLNAIQQLAVDTKSTLTAIAVTVFGNTLSPHGTLRASSISPLPARNARINPGIALELVFFLRSRETLHNIRFRQTSDF
jgi:hypothetical protein